MTKLLEHLRNRGAGGRKLLVPYFMAGVQGFRPALEGAARHADAIEIGLPFSDPLMDGPVIAAAGEHAIRAGVGPLAALDMAAAGPDGAPRVAMTYYNPIHKCGESAFCKRAAAAGVSGLIVPDVPLEESSSLRRAAADEGIAWVPLVAPTTSARRAAAIAETATGFVYAVSTMGVTGVRASLSERAAEVARRCRAASDVPVLVGIGVSTPEQAVEAVAEADGVVIGSAVVRLLADEGPAAAEAFLASVRAALDA